MNTQLSLFGASPDQNTFQSMQWGLLTFYPAKTDKWKDTCRHCLLWGDYCDECLNAPCSSFSRTDGKEGYFSIHDMPKGGAQ